MSARTQPRPASVARRLSHVQVPPSPFRTPSSSRVIPAPTTIQNASDQENSPVVKQHTVSSPTKSIGPSTPSLKRKRSEHDLSPSKGRDMASVSLNPKPKKHKVSPDASLKSPSKKASVSTKPTVVATGEDPKNASEEFPEGSFYCHQCARKKHVKDGLQCTVATPKGRCKARYCKACLDNRYRFDMDEIISKGNAGKTTEHVKGAPFIFKCPKCQDNCNCRYCRKAKGLEPLGNFNLAAKKAEAEAAAKDEKDGKTSSIKPKNKQNDQADKKTKAVDKRAKGSTSAKPTTSASATRVVPKPKRPSVPKSKPLPIVPWKRVPLPEHFTHSAILSRIAIREFVLRFSSFFDISRANLEELEEIAGSSANGRRRALSEDEDEAMLTEEECEVSLGWVSEVSVKSIIVGLLNLAAENETAVGSKEGKKIVLTAAKDVNNCGANLSRLWGVLSTMRSSLYDLCDPQNGLDFPDPLPPPVMASAYGTRSGKLTGNGVHVATSAQLVYVVEALVEYALAASSVRDEMTKTETELKELSKQDRERTKEEKDLWEEAKKNATKTDRAQHKFALSSIEQAFRVASHATNPRFTPLGIDQDGRIYYALNPAAAEQEAALALLQGDKKKSGKARGRAHVTEDERKALGKWSWFIAVWGKKPEAEKGVEAKKGKAKKAAGGENEEGSDDGEEKFWAFWQPEDVRTLAKWIEMKNGLDGDEKVAKTTSTTKSASAAKPKPVVYVKPLANGKAATSPFRSGTSTKISSRAASSTVVPTDLDGDVDSDSSSRISSPLSDVSDEENEREEELSELSSPLSDADAESEDEEQDPETQMRSMMRVDEDGKVLACRKDLEALVKSLQEYADVLEWRISRMVDDEVEVGEKGKGKA